MSDARTAQLAKLDQALKANPLLRYNNPHPLLNGEKIHHKQMAFHDAKTRVKVFTGGTRSGKSSSGVVDDLIQLLPREWIPPHLEQFKRKDPPFKLRIITPDLGHTMSAVLDGLRQWTPPAALRGSSWDTAYDKTKRLLHFSCGSRIDFMSFETDLDKFGGVALDRVHMDEEPPGEKGEAIYTQSLRRLVDYQGDLLLTATPEFGLSWTSTTFWDERGPEIAERVWQNDWLTIVRATTHDNPFVPHDELSESQMTEEEYKVKVLGEWFHLQGLVYPEFDEQKHAVEPPEAKHVQDLQTVIGIDPGIRTTAVVFCGFDKDNSMLVYDELYLHNDEAIPENAAKHIKSKLKAWGVKAQRYVIDPSARNRSLVNADNVEAAYSRAGIQCSPGQNEREAGVFEIKRRLNGGAWLISRTCKTLIWEMRRYRMDDKADGGFEVIKKDDHLLDAMRYVAMERTWWQPGASKPKRQPSYGENPGHVPPYKPKDFIPPEPSPMGTYT